MTSKPAVHSRPTGPARRRRPLGEDRGVSSLELAFIAPTLLLLIFFVIQAVLLLYGRSVALQAARDGVTQLRLQQTVDACEASKSGVGQSVVEFANQVGSGALTAPNAYPSCNFNTGGTPTVTVKVTGEAISLVGFTMHISQTASGPVEQFQTGG